MQDQLKREHHVAHVMESWILDSKPWIPDSRYWIPVFWQWNSDYGFLSFEGFCIPWAVFRNKAQDCRFHKQTFHVIRIPQAKISRFGTGFPYNWQTTLFEDSSMNIGDHDPIEVRRFPHTGGDAVQANCFGAGDMVRTYNSKRPVRWISTCVEGWLRCVTVVTWGHKD